MHAAVAARLVRSCSMPLSSLPLVMCRAMCVLTCRGVCRRDRLVVGALSVRASLWPRAVCCVTHTQANISTGEAVARRHGLFHRFRAFNTRLCAAPHKCIKNTSSAYKICD